MTESTVPSTIDRRSLLRAAGAGLGAALLPAVAGCRGLSTADEPKSGSLSLTWWGEGKRAQLGVKVTEQFESSHPGVTLNPQFSSFAGYFDKLATRVAGGNPPDIFQLQISNLAEYAERGACRSLDDLWSDPLGLDKAPEAVQKSCQIGGTHYFVPLGVATVPAVVYNRSLLTELKLQEPAADWTLEDLRRLGGEVRRASGGKLYGITDFGGSHQALGAFVRSKGKPLFTDAGELGFSEADLAEWYGLWKETRDSKTCVPMKISAAGTGFQNNPMIKGKAAISFAASSKGLEGLQNLTDDELALAPFPRYDGSAQPGTLITPVEWFAMSAKLSDDQADLAAQLCRYWLTDEKALATVKLWHGAPLFPDLAEQMKSEASGVEKQIYDNLDVMREQQPGSLTPYPPGAQALVGNLNGKNNEAIGFGESSVDEAVTKFFAEAPRVLGK